MPSYDETGKISYAYDADTDTWYAILGKASTSANYEWSGSHGFASNVIAKLKFNCFLNPAARASAISNPAVGLLTFIQEDAGANTVNRFEFWDGSAWTPIADPNAASLNGTETLTNKTLSGTNNTFSDIPVAAIDGLDTELASLSNTYAPKNFTINTTTGNYTLVLGDALDLIQTNTTSANTITIPTNASVPFPVGTSIMVVQINTGQTTFAGASGVTLNGTPGLKLRARWSSATLIKRGTDSWIAIGDLSA